MMTIDKAWNVLFEKHDILSRVSSEGCYHIKASEINTVKEARLMAKFDQTVQLPEVFKTNTLAILPVSRGEYVIGPFQAYQSIEYPRCKPAPIAVPNLATIDHTNLYSEASALLFAYNSGIIQNIVHTGDIHYTVNGRMSSGNFDFFINNAVDENKTQRIAVQNAQVEIDAGYEFSDGFCIVEAKNVAVDEILIRQLYYPYRLWSGKIAKPVIPVFMVFSNDIFYMFHYAFEDPHRYNSLKLLSCQAYTFAGETIALHDLIEVWKSIKTHGEPEAAFPQADRFTRVIDLLSVLFERGLTREEVTEKYGFDSRQTSYYIAACDYLNLIERTKNINGEQEYQLSAEAKNMMTLPYKKKNLALVKRILERPVFHDVFGCIIGNNRRPDKRAVCDIMGGAKLSINQTTIERRSATVLSWIDWILSLAENSFGF
jgi:hypothetical protein